MNRRNLKFLYKKEMMDVIRDKKTMLAMFLLPLILYPLIFIVVMQVMVMINHNREEHVYKIAYSGGQEKVVEELTKFIAGEEDELDYVFEVVSAENAEAELKEEKVDAVIEVKEQSGNYTFQISYLSAVTNSNNCLSMYKEELEAFRKKLSVKRAGETGLNVDYLINPVKSEGKDLSSRESSIGNILGTVIPFMLIISILMGATYPAIDTTSGEKERGTLETLLTLPISNMELITSKFLSVATLSLISVLINVLSIGGIIAYLYATIASMSDSVKGLHLSDFIPAVLIAMICISAFALFISAIFMCVCSFAKSFKEANNYITPLMLVIMFVGYIGFIPNVVLDYKMALIPVANICLLIKDLLVFKYNFSLIFIVLFSNILYAMITVMFLASIYRSENLLFGDATGMKLFERRKNLKKGSMPTPQEAVLVLVIVLLAMTYIGGLATLKNLQAGILIQQGFVLLLPVLATIYIKGDYKKIYSIRLPKPLHLCGALLVFAGGYLLTSWIGGILEHFFPSQSSAVSEQFELIIKGVPFPAAVLLIALLPAVCEEILFRGYLMRAFLEKFSVPVSILFVAVLFGISHMSFVRFPGTAVLGAFLCYMVYKSGSLLTSMLVHFLNNATAVCVMYYGDRLQGVERFLDQYIFLYFGIMIVSLAAGVILLRNASTNGD